MDDNHWNINFMTSFKYLVGKYNDYAKKVMMMYIASPPISFSPPRYAPTSIVLIVRLLFFRQKDQRYRHCALSKRTMAIFFAPTCYFSQFQKALSQSDCSIFSRQNALDQSECRIPISSNNGSIVLGEKQ